MPNKINTTDAKYFLGFDGGGTKTECVLADAQGRILARAASGPSNPLRTGYTRAWFSLSGAADSVLGRQQLRAGDIRGICAGLGGAGRTGVVRRAKMFFEHGFPSAQVRVTTDLEILIGQVGGVFGRSKFFDRAIEAELKNVCPRASLVASKMSPAEAAVQMAIRQSLAKGNAA